MATENSSLKSTQPSGPSDGPSCAVASGWAQITTEKWGCSLARAERMTISHGSLRNAYYGLKILGVKILVWHWAFDGVRRE